MGRRPLLKKADVLAAVQRWLAEHGDSPSVEELRKVLGVGSTRTVFRYLQALKDDGVVGSDSHGVSLLRPRQTTCTTAIPIVGRVPAGPMMVAEENIEGWIQVPQEIAPRRSRYFLLRVRGNSMDQARIAGHAIEDGDLVLVRQQSTASPSDIVVAVTDGEATVKRLAAGPGYYMLKPESSEPTHRPILVEEGFTFSGVVTRVFKRGSEILGLVHE